MASNRETIEMRLKLQRARQFERGTNKAARSIDNLGDQAEQAARKLARLNAATGKTRVQLGPLSGNLRFATLAVGGLILGMKTAVPWTLSLAEGIGTVGVAAGAVGLVGLTALGQGSLVASLGLKDLTEALGGNEAAAKRLAPEAQNLFYSLSRAQQKLRLSASQGLFPGLERGSNAALADLPVIDRVVSKTAKTLGNLGGDAGTMFGSKAWGRDMADIGDTNVKIIDNLGHAGLNLADAARHIIHEAGPLTEWLSEAALKGSKLTKVWVRNKRATGELSDFFKRAQTNMRLLGRIGGHGAAGVLNLFGNRDVDGTQTLRNLNRIMARFENWTAAIKGKPLGPEIEKQLAAGLGAAASFLGSHIGAAGATAAGAFATSFMSADVWGKGIIAAFVATKLGLTKGLFESLGKGAGGGLKKGLSKGNKLTKANAVPVWVINQTGGLPGGKDKPVDKALKTGGLTGALATAGRALGFVGPAGGATAGAAASIFGGGMYLILTNRDPNAKQPPLSTASPVNPAGSIPAPGYGTSTPGALNINNTITLDGKVLHQSNQKVDAKRKASRTARAHNGNGANK